MDYKLETTGNIGRKMTITVPVADVNVQVDKRLQEMSRRVRLDGFRPGKVPMKVLRRRYGEGARYEVLGDVMQQAFFDAVQKEKVVPAGAPSVETVSDDDNGFVFMASFDVYPEITVNDFASIEVERPVASVEASDIDEMIETLRKQTATFEVVERAAANGDQILLDYTGSVDGVEFAGGKASNSTLELGSGHMIPGFEDALVGVTAGEERTIKVTFPAEYHNKDLAGKDAEFACNIHSVSAPALAELNDEFFARFGVSEGGLDAFRKEIEKNMDRELRQAIKNKVKSQVMDGLLHIHDVDAPSGLVNQEIDRMREQVVQQFGGPRGGLDPKKLPVDLFQADAMKRVSLGLLIGEVIKQRDIKADDERVRVMIEEMAAAYQEPQQVIDWYYGNNEQLENVRFIVMEEQVVDAVLAAAKVTDKKMSYQEAVKPAEADAEEA